MTEHAQRLAALLFVAGEPVSKDELTELLAVPPEDLADLLSEVTATFSGSGLALVATEKEVELVTSPEVSGWLAEKAGSEPETLSRAAAETLAVVAYKGPVTRYEVDLLRGVDSRRTIRHLLRRGAISRLSRRGRAPEYDISLEFLKQLGLSRREDLPGHEELLSHPGLNQLLQRSQ